MTQSELLGVSTDAPATPRLQFHLHPHDDAPPASWGVAWYPSDDPNASFMKDVSFRGDICVNDTLPPSERLTSSIVVAHTRVESKRASRSDAQPFRRPYANADCVFAHAGDLELSLSPDSVGLDDWTNPEFPDLIRPVGSTDSERVFCRLLQRLSSRGGSTLGALGWHTLHAWLLEANQHGAMSVLISNGLDLIAYRDAAGDRPLWQTRRPPPRDESTLRCGNHTVTLEANEDASRVAFVFASRPDHTEHWTELAPGQMVVVRNAAVLWASAPGGAPPQAPPQCETPLVSQSQDAAQSPPGASFGAGATSPNTPDAPSPAPRTLAVIHETKYTYTNPVEASRHIVRLHPTNDNWQQVLEHSLQITPAGGRVSFEDVFGNQAVRLDFDEPYAELSVRMSATVRIDSAELLTMPQERQQIPLTWMPWQRQMMHAYLLPPELPETQLRELSEYAMSFVERRDYDVVDTLIDMNNSIRQDFAYVSGSTTTETTPFEVYTSRRGVCQDFANLFICMARLVGIPARYRVGYIYTGSNYENKIQSDATHAWAEAYLPHVGWRGFDPTNGCLAGADHIRVAVGRNFRDATPTSGTIFRGGAGEILSIHVRVHDVV